ncbi:iron chelate uptake ABC transporter family permease subunit [Labrenzia sp. DG1229]|uniref:FecCD family ABC transporter permease n=1 Tax=Labrenzia sp. DG1229 TaxID=681847 RepID=UPI00068A0093|nr:iron chelate uptake ABC transporter family permease subunit [Labrenzia sp. DG1229]
MRYHIRHGVKTTAAGFASLFVSVVAAISLGPAEITFREVLRILADNCGLVEYDIADFKNVIIWEMRLPRSVTAALVGAGLAVSGSVIQGVTRNPLADPYLLGLSSGAALGAMIALLFFGHEYLLPPFAFAGALSALAVTMGMAQAVGGATPTNVILAGIAVSAVASSATSLVIFGQAMGDAYREVIEWMLGTLAGSTWTDATVAAIVFAVAVPTIWLNTRVLDVLALGDAGASALGINVNLTRWKLFSVTALLTGAMVSVSGAIGFVGLVVPHVVRLITGDRHRFLVPLSALFGSVVMVWADTFARIVVQPRELPVGVVTALIGAPIFGALLYMRSR